MAENKPMSTITKERLEPVIERLEHYATNVKWTNVQAAKDMLIAVDAMRRLLASLEAEPVAYADPQAFRNFQSGVARREWMWADPDAGLIPLHTAPPAPVSVPDEDLLHMAASAIEDLLSNKNRSGAGVWADIPAKLLSAAMLQGAENTVSRCTTQTAPALDSSPKNAESRCGNSPVIPDGLNIRAVAALREAVRNQWLNSDEFADRVYWKTMHDIANEIVSAMLASAPQQEV